MCALKRVYPKQFGPYKLVETNPFQLSAREFNNMLLGKSPRPAHKTTISKPKPKTFMDFLPPSLKSHKPTPTERLLERVRRDIKKKKHIKPTKKPAAKPKTFSPMYRAQPKKRPFDIMSCIRDIERKNKMDKLNPKAKPAAVKTTSSSELFNASLGFFKTLKTSPTNKKIGENFLESYIGKGINATLQETDDPYVKAGQNWSSGAAAHGLFHVTKAKITGKPLSLTPVGMLTAGTSNLLSNLLPDDNKPFNAVGLATTVGVAVVATVATPVILEVAGVTTGVTAVGLLGEAAVNGLASGIDYAITHSK